MSKNSTNLNKMNRTHASSHSERIVYKGFFSVKEHNLSYRMFNNEQSEVVRRSTLISSDAAIVLPYDPVNDRVLLIEQFRTGPYVKGDDRPWVLEPIAGLIDSGESPEQAGIREAREEAQLEIETLLLVARSYPSPGISTEFFHQYVGLVSLPESSNLVSGLASESEDIRSHIFSYKEFSKMISKGKINVGPAILIGLWLAKNRKKILKKYSFK